LRRLCVRQSHGKNCVRTATLTGLPTRPLVARARGLAGGKQFAKQSVFDAHLTGKKHLKVRAARNLEAVPARYSTLGSL